MKMSNFYPSNGFYTPVRKKNPVDTDRKQTSTNLNNIKDKESDSKYFSSSNVLNLNFKKMNPNMTTGMLNPTNEEDYKNFEQHKLKMNILEQRLDTFNNKREEERKTLLDIVATNVINPDLKNNTNRNPIFDTSMNSFNSTNSRNNTHKLTNSVNQNTNPNETNNLITINSNEHPNQDAKLNNSLYNSRNAKGIGENARVNPMTEQDEDVVMGIRPDDEDDYPVQQLTMFQRYNGDNDDGIVLDHNYMQTMSNNEFSAENIHALESLNEIKGDVHLFKEEILRSIKKLQNKKDQFQVSNLLNEMTDLRDSFLEDAKFQREKADDEYRALRDGFRELKRDVHEKITDENNHSKNILNELSNELKGYQNEIERRVKEMEEKQKNILDRLKFVMETNPDDRTRALAGKFLVESKEEFEKNKQTFIKPSSLALNKVMETMRNKSKETTKKNKDNIFLDLLNKRRNKNSETIKQVTTKESNLGKKDKDFKQLVDLLGDRLLNSVEVSKEPSKKVKPLNRFRKFVHAVNATFRLKTLVVVVRLTRLYQSISEFNKIYSEGDELLKKFINDSAKMSLTSLVNSDQLNLDLVEFKSANLRNNSEAKSRFVKLMARLKGFMDNLMENTNNQQINQNLMTYLKFIVKDGNLIPCKFFTLYELIRIPSKDGYLTGIIEKHTALILCFYILIKILVKHLLIEQTFLSMEARRKMSPNVVKNLKMIASIIFYETLEIFNKTCPTVNTISNYEDHCTNQSKHFVSDKTKKSNKIKLLNDIKSELDKANQRLPNFTPDENINTQDFIQKSLYKQSDLNCYYVYAKESKFELTKIIFVWVKQLMKLIKEK